MTQPAKKLPPPVAQGTTARVRSARADIAPLALSTGIVIWLVLSARSSAAGSSIEISTHTTAAVIVGGFLNSVLFSWFQSGEMKRLANPSYVIPSWSPKKVAVLLMLVSLVSSLLCAFWIGLSWSRR
jgi:hypothetical protein